MYKDVLIILIAILLVCFLTQAQRSLFDDRIETLSTIDGQKYLVRQNKFEKATADALARLKSSIATFVDKLESTETGAFQPIVKRIKSRIQNMKIAEGIVDRRYTTYTVDKGSHMVMCMRSRDGKDILYDDNTLFGVALHELGHIASLTSDPLNEHNDEFKKNYAYLKSAAENMKLFTPITKPFDYCGLPVTSL